MKGYAQGRFCQVANRKVCSVGGLAFFHVRGFLTFPVAANRNHRILGWNWDANQDPSECTLSCFQTASNHPAEDVALVDTQTAAGIARSAEVGVLGFAASGV